MKTIKLTILIIVICSNFSFGQEEFTNYTEKEGLTSNKVLDFLEDKQGRLWIATDKGLNILDGTQFETFDEKDGLPGNSVHQLLEEDNGDIWIKTDRGFSKYTGMRFLSMSNAEKSSPYVFRYLEKWNNDIWIGGFIRKANTGFIAKNFDGQSMESLTAIGDDECKPFRMFSMDSKCNIWTVGYNTKGDYIYRFDGSGWESFGDKDGLPGNANSRMVEHILEDSHGNMWFAAAVELKYGSLAKFDGVTWKVFSKADGMAGKCIHQIVEDHSGNIWAATDKGLYIYDGISWKNLSEQHNLKAKFLLEMMVDSKGRVWIGTDVGLYMYDKGRCSTFNKKNGLTQNYVRIIEEDSQGNIWVGVAPHGISVFVGGKWKHLKLPDIYLKKFYEDSKGNMWLLTMKDGVYNIPISGIK